MNYKQADKSRRDFMKKFMLASGSAALLTHPLTTTANFANMSRSLPQNLSGYKAMVCIFLQGGNDSTNMLVPRSAGAYKQYAGLRQNLAIPQDQLLKLNLKTSQNTQYGLHPRLSGMKSLFDSGKLSFVANIGSLIEPVSYDAFQNKTATLPAHLFSHSDQVNQWQSAYPQQQKDIGWAGRIADLLNSTVNDESDLPMNTRFSTNTFSRGANTQPLNISRHGFKKYLATADQRKTSHQEKLAVYNALLTKKRAHLMAGEYARIQESSLHLSGKIVDVVENLPELKTKFPDSKLGRELKVVAQMIHARDGFEMNRQCFFVKKGGFDTHANQSTNQPELYGDLDACLVAFQAALEELGIEDNVVTFSASDFGRSIGTNGDGTDHGWGGHHFVMGTSVQGGDIFGRMPNLDINGKDSVKNGRLLPQYSVDQYSATIARWYGLTDNMLDAIFPNLNNFSTRDLGFIA